MEVFGQIINGNAGSRSPVSNPVESSINTDPVRVQNSRHSFNCLPDPACTKIACSFEDGNVASHLCISKEGTDKFEFKSALASFPDPTINIFMLIKVSGIAFIARKDETHILGYIA